MVCICLYGLHGTQFDFSVKIFSIAFAFEICCICVVSTVAIVRSTCVLASGCFCPPAVVHLYFETRLSLRAVVFKLFRWNLGFREGILGVP
jgi:hypothetical protein